MSKLLNTMINMPKQISNDEVYRLSKAQQIFSDCYLVASINSLTRTEKGRELLKSHIRTVNSPLGDPKNSGYVIHYSNINNTKRDVFVSKEEIANLDIERARRVKHSFVPENETLKAIEISLGKLLKEKPSLKYFVSRFHPSLERFEYDLPSNFMKMFLGKDLISVNEKNVSMRLSSDTEKAKKLLTEIGNSNGKQHFIAGTSYPLSKIFKAWHCYVVKNVNNQKNTITLYETRTAKELNVDIDYFIKKFKFISGYFEK